jgi:hypothetical protein
MPSERFMKHHYGVSNWVNPRAKSRRKEINTRITEIDLELDKFPSDAVLWNSLLMERILIRTELRRLEQPDA